MKKILSLLLCAGIVFSGTLCANAAQAAQVKEYEGFEVLGDELILPDNTLRLSSIGLEYNENTLSKNIIFTNTETKENYKVFLNDYSEQEGEFYLPNGKYKVNYSNMIMDSSKIGGVYKKIKIKLSEFNNGLDTTSFFNSNGTFTFSMFDEQWIAEYKKTNDSEKNAVICSEFVYMNGAIISRMLPDKNGEIEVYASTEIGDTPTIYLSCSVSQGGRQGAVGNKIHLKKLTFGNINADEYLDVKDVTTLQLCLAGIKEFDTLSLYHSDTNGDGLYNVTDVTTLQLALANM